MLTNTQRATLRTELLTDPLARGYAAMSDDAAAASLNTKNRTPDRTTITAAEIVSAIVRSEFDALSAANKTYVQTVLNVGGSIPLTAQFRSDMGAIFGAATTTRANITAQLKRSASRCEELLGEGVKCDYQDAYAARNEMG